MSSLPSGVVPYGQLPLLLSWNASTNPLPIRLVRPPGRVRPAFPQFDPPPWLPTGPFEQPFDFGGHMRRLCADIALRCEELRHVERMVGGLEFAVGLDDARARFLGQQLARHLLEQVGESGEILAVDGQAGGLRVAAARTASRSARSAPASAWTPGRAHRAGENPGSSAPIRAIRWCSFPQNRWSAGGCARARAIRPARQ